MNDSISRFLKAISEAGIEPPMEAIPDGRLHRFSSNGKRGDKAGWYVFHPDEPAAGQFGCWRLSISQTWCSKSKDKMTPAECTEFKRRMDESKRSAEAARKADRARAAAKAQSEWREAKSADLNHPYLKKKRVKPYLIRQDAVNRLLVPMFKGDRIVGMQHISEDGEKHFMFGSDKCGASYLLAGDPSAAEKILIVEGMATAASVHEATGLPVFIAFDAGNLKPAAEAIRKQYPKAAIVIAGDNDDFQNCRHKDCGKTVRLSTDGDTCPHCDRPHGETNTGKEAAKVARSAVGGSWIIPDFSGLDTSGKPTDFNDLHQLAGPEAVRMQIEANAEEAPKDTKQQTEADLDLAIGGDRQQSDDKYANDGAGGTVDYPQVVRGAIKRIKAEGTPSPAMEEATIEAMTVLQKQEGEQSLADELVTIVTESGELFHCGENDAYITMHEAPHKTYLLQTKSFREWLSWKCRNATGKTPSESMLASVILALSGEAKHEGEMRDVYLRAAPAPDGGYMLDLCNDDWQAAHITAAGWRIVDKPPVRFRRTETMKPLPMPVPGGNCNALWRFVPVPVEYRILFVAWMFECWRQVTPFPILEVLGG